MSDNRDELEPPFEILEPAEWQGPVVFNSPHSGNIYPPAFLSAARLDLAQLRRSEDSFVDELFTGVVRRGSPLMRAHFPRCYVDVNREPYELDPRMFDGRLPSFANTRSMRVAGGLGTVARVVGESQEIYGQRITVEAVLRGRGYVVSRNKPYAGGFITEHYGNPAVGLHAIQLELNRALYMDERRYERSASFQSVAADLEF